MLSPDRLFDPEQKQAVHVVQKYSRNIRVNAIAPGFFITDQNRYLITGKALSIPNGKPSRRSKRSSRMAF